MTPANWPGSVRPLLWTILSGSATAGGRLFRGRVTAPTTAASDGWSLGRGFVASNPTGAFDCPVSMMWWPSEWSFDGCVSDRTSVHRSDRAASFGRCSQILTPVVFVAIGLNSPRTSAAASGFGSKLSCWARPPERKT